MNKVSLILAFLLLTSSVPAADESSKSEGKIQIAILLDVSGSMGGLISQAKGQLWTLVNELTTAERDGQKVDFEISIISYGHGGGFFFGETESQQSEVYTILTPLTSDIDLISESLFQLTSSGSEEPCGLVISEALKQLNWSKSKHDVKILFIAGNEEFNQGIVNYEDACRTASKMGVTVNTIYCGAEQMGIDQLWANAAKIGKGEFHTIEQDSLIRHSETYWDNKIIKYNDLVNSTYLAYGNEGKSSKERQIGQDENALDLGNAYLRDRVIFKLSPNYKNPTWDLVDKFEEDSTILSSLKIDQLPFELHGLSYEQKVRLIQKKAKQREVYFEAAQIFIDRAKAELAEKGIEEPKLEVRTLDRTMISTLKNQVQQAGVTLK